MNNFRRNNPFFNRRRRKAFNFNNNRNGNWKGMLMTLLGLGAGAAAWFGLSQNRNNNKQQPIQEMFANAQRGGSRTQAAFAEELLPDVMNSEDKSTE